MIFPKSLITYDWNLKKFVASSETRSKLRTFRMATRTLVYVSLSHLRIFLLMRARVLVLSFYILKKETVCLKYVMTLLKQSN